MKVISELKDKSNEFTWFERKINEQIPRDLITNDPTFISLDPRRKG